MMMLDIVKVIHYELPNDTETFVHHSGRIGRAGKDGTAIIMFSSSQRRTVTSLERDVGCRFEHVSAPSVEEVLESSAHQVVSTLAGVHPESLAFFTPMAEKLIEEQGTNALAAALAQLSGFAQPPSARSLITHEQGRVILQLIRDSGATRGFLSARSVMGFLSDVYRSTADEVGKILLVADERVQGAVFDLPEEIAKELLTMQLPPGNSISKIKKLPALQDDGPPSDFYGRFSNNRGSGGSRGGSKDRRPSGNSRGGWGSGRSSDFGSGRNSNFGDDDSFGRGGRSSVMIRR